MQDTFKDGDVIRWTSSGKYSFTALKTPGGWYTSAAKFGKTIPSGVPQIANWDQLYEILKRDEVTDVQVATSWGDLFADWGII